ncbi:hypothetical protein EIN_267700 [Entamoeba invadens IP1]|uniref:Uncharacterized protein n=1 Tax=Entamoeba invadens IP1 TaxID=370355 RepID=A0A0A1U7Y7_ENTIV|nr:hypothetical protein EIN_267700 [Entamoeba invadens IP1]ELP91044.1 hypothetical protein EIN_267700 [Entamoeba invadens IP1]|eukprot:XP_004257815.1 hypothetical protein EIN_267700 [Entamoeba invadens IP1]
MEKAQQKAEIMKTKKAEKKSSEKSDGSNPLVKSKSEPQMRAVVQPNPLQPLSRNRPFSMTALVTPKDLSQNDKRVITELYYIDAKRNYLVLKSEVEHLKRKKKVLDKEIDPTYFAEKERINNALYNKIRERDSMKVEFKLKKKEKKNGRVRIL